jgi:hypothetical protein
VIYIHFSIMPLPNIHYTRCIALFQVLSTYSITLTESAKQFCLDTLQGFSPIQWYAWKQFLTDMRVSINYFESDHTEVNLQIHDVVIVVNGDNIKHIFECFKHQYPDIFESQSVMSE